MINSAHVSDLRGALSSVWIFSDLSGAELRRIADLASRRVVAAKSVIVSKGERAQEFFMILRGKAMVTSRGSDGNDIAFGVMGVGEVFGEMALLDQGPRSATVTAMEECELGVIESSAFLSLLRMNPEIGVKLLTMMARRLRELSLRMEERVFLNVKARLAHQLLILGRQYGATTGDGVAIEVRLSQGELAALVGAGRESVNKQLRDWERQGLLTLGRGRILLGDVAGLRRVFE